MIEFTYSQAAATSRPHGTSGESIAVEIPLLIPTLGDLDCTMGVRAQAGYERSNGSDRVYEWVLAAAQPLSCEDSPVKRIEVYASISDSPPLSPHYGTVYSTASSGFKIPPFDAAGVEVKAEQSVPLYEIPYDYHGPGSRITFRAEGYALIGSAVGDYWIGMCLEASVVHGEPWITFRPVACQVH